MAFSSGFGQPSFGQQQQQTAFGSQTPQPFGNQSTPFGSSAFNNQQPPASNNLFGSQQQQQQPFSAFGASSSSLFGASQPAFSSFASSSSLFASSSAFAASTSAFASQPAFGASAAFGAPSNNSLFGASRPPSGFAASAPAFGQSTAAWGASSAAFGASSAFGATNAFAASSSSLFAPASGSTLFGSQPAFGAAAPNNPTGTAAVQWQLTMEYDGNPGVASKYQAISMMHSLRGKSLEELRMEDYAAGNKGDGTTPAAPPSNNSLFGSNPQSTPSSTLFGAAQSTPAFASSNSFGATTAFGSGASSFGAQQPAFGASSSSLFGGGGAGAGNAFGQSTPFAQSGSTAFGASAFGATQSGAGAFGQSAPTFGAASTGGSFGNSTPAFGGGGGAFGAAAQQSSGGIFGNTGGVFGAQQSQSLFGATSQPGNTFGANPASTNTSLFGNTGTQTAPPLFNNSTPSSNIFGQTGTAPAQTPFGGNQNQQKSPFGAPAINTGFNPPAGGALGAAPTGNAAFNSTGQPPSFGVQSSGPGFSAGGAFAQPVANQNPPAPLLGGGNAGFAQTPAVGQGSGVNPTLMGTFSSVTQENGATVAPPNANYGTVLHNLQKLQGDLEQQKKLLEQQAQNNAASAAKPGALSVVVVPSTSMLKLTTNRWNSSSGDGRWSARAPHRTRMRNSVGRLTSPSTKVASTPFSTPTAVKSEDVPAGATTGAVSVVRKMPFFSPQQFSGPKRQSPGLGTPTNLPSSTPNSNNRLGGGRRTGMELNLSYINSAHKSSARPPSARNGTQSLRTQANGNMSKSAPGDNEVDVIEITPNSATPRPSSSQNPSRTQQRHSSVRSGGSRAKETTTPSEKRPNNGRSSSAADFIWSSPRPSTWSLKTPLESIDQYDPEKYLPILSNEGYYTIPSLSDLSARTMKELQTVEGFTVGRKGFGEVKWVEPVDVRGLNLDQVVEIRQGEIAVYPDRDADQLDAPAVVTLLGMFKKDKKTGKRSTDGKVLDKYANKLKQFCDESNLVFISYDGTRGEWIFEASSFAEMT